MIRLEINPNMLILARQVRGLTQSEIATRLGVSQGRISKMEQGLINIDDFIIEQLGKMLSFPKTFFSQPGQIYPADISLYRKRQSLSKRDTDQINALINLKYQHLGKLLQSVEVENHVPFMDLDEFNTPQNVAIHLRRNWKLPNGPIDNLTALLESAGIFVFHINIPNPQFDGIRFVADSLVPIIALNKNMPPDRIRFTLAHELGHLVMHKIKTPTADDEANIFASEFLIPSHDIEFPLGRLTLTHLADLKRYWKVSMASLLMKATDLGVITHRQSQYLWSQMSQLGYRKREPGELDPPMEKPRLIGTIIKLHLHELEYSEQDIRDLFALHENDFNDWWGDDFPDQKQQPPLKLTRGGMFYRN